VTALARTWDQLTLPGRALLILLPVLGILTIGLVVVLALFGQNILDILVFNLPIVRFVFAATVLLLLAPPIAFVIIYMEMKVIALMNLRIGPDRVGPWGSLLSTVHGLKVLMKEDFTPTRADPVVFTWAPVIVFATMPLSALVIPFAPGLFGQDFNIGLLYFFAIGGLTVVGLLMGGWGSFNKYSLLGGLRSAAQIVSYEIPLTLSVVGLIILAGTMSLNSIVQQQGIWIDANGMTHGSGWLTDWFAFRQPLGFLIFAIAATAEANRTPFDLTEADSEFTRSYRFGEWLFEPVTPLFESWLLSEMEESFHTGLRAAIGQRVPRPYHVLVNGWYFYTLNWASPAAFLRNGPRMLMRALRSPRSVAGILPATVRHAYPLVEKEWREDLQPRYRAAMRRAADAIERVSSADLPAIVDQLANLAGEYFLSVAALTGAAYKTELRLAGFYRKHLRGALGWSHLPLVSGFDATVDLDESALVSLDWWFEPRKLGPDANVPLATHAAVIEARKAAEVAATAALAASPGRLRTFHRLLSDAQHLLSIRDEQTRELAIAWPVMRRAVLRIGQALAEQGWIEDVDDVFFLTRAEVQDALRGSPAVRIDVRGRREIRAEQARLVPPLVVGRLPRMVERMWNGFAAQVGAVHSARALVSGAPASAGRATGVVRVIRGPDEFDTLEVGEILVAPMTAPAWTPLFARAAGLVTDIGSAASHASLVAREYGIPAVVGAGDATSRLRTGMRVTVDGSTGNVEPA
jgi:NADH:ubiquinone oxidoreductase subunit H/phosphohistidine swiveling domain-containing protein